MGYGELKLSIMHARQLMPPPLLCHSTIFVLPRKIFPWGSFKGGGGGGGGGGGKHSRGKCSFLNETPHNSRAVNEQLCTGIPAISFFKPVLQSHTDTLQTQVDQSSSAHFDHQRYELTVSAVHVVTFVHVQVILPN